MRFQQPLMFVIASALAVLPRHDLTRAQATEASRPHNAHGFRLAITIDDLLSQSYLA
jgi:hypothetical protein